MLTQYKPNARGTRIAVIQHSPRRKQLGQIRRTAKGPVFVAKTALTRADLSGLMLYLSGIK